MKRVLIWLIYGEKRVVKLKWSDGDESNADYTLREAAYSLDHFKGHDYGIVKKGILKGLKFT